MEPEFDADPEIRLGPEDGGSLPSQCSNQEALELQDKSKTLPSRMTVACLAELSDKKKPKVSETGPTAKNPVHVVASCIHIVILLQVPPPVPKKPNVLLLPPSVHSSTNGRADRQTPRGADSPAGLRSPRGTFPPEEERRGSPGVPETPEQDEDHSGIYEEISKESPLHDSPLTELEGKLGDTGSGAGT